MSTDARRAVLKLDPSAARMSWRILGYNGGVVYGVVSSAGEWLSFNCLSAGAAWRLALRCLQAKADPSQR